MSIGGSIGTSLVFMAEFIGTFGSGWLKSAAKAGVKAAAKGIAKSAVKGGLSKIGRGAERVAERMTKDGVPLSNKFLNATVSFVKNQSFAIPEAAIQSVIQPSFWNEVGDRIMRGQGTSEALGNTLYDRTIENWSERVFVGAGEFGKLTGSALDFGKLKGFKGIINTAKGIGEEYAEELIGDAVKRVPWTGKQSFSEAYKGYWGEDKWDTFLSVAFITGVFGGAGHIYNKAVKIKYDGAAKIARNALPEMLADDIDGLLDSGDVNSESTVDALSGLIESSSRANNIPFDKLASNVNRYIAAKFNQKGFELARQNNETSQNPEDTTATEGKTASENKPQNKMLLNGKEVSKIEILGDGKARIIDVEGNNAYFPEEKVKGYDENGVFVGEAGNAQNFVSDKEGNLVGVEKNTNFDENISDNGIRNDNRGVPTEVEGGIDEAGIQRGSSERGGGRSEGYGSTSDDRIRNNAEGIRQRNSESRLNEDTEKNLSNNTYLQRPKKSNGRPSYEPVKLRNANVEEFSEATRVGKRDNPHGAFVDLHTPEEYDKMKVRLLSEDGKSGIAIEEDGNIVNLFSTNSSTNGVSHALFLAALENGGVKGDNFDGHLTKLYTQMGTIPVARVKFNDEFAPEGWDYERDGRKDIVFWMHNGESASEVAKKIGSYEEVDVGTLPLFDSYDEAAAYRDKLLEDRKKESAEKTQARSKDNLKERLDSIVSGYVEQEKAKIRDREEKNTERELDEIRWNLSRQGIIVNIDGRRIRVSKTRKGGYNTKNQKAIDAFEKELDNRMEQEKPRVQTAMEDRIKGYDSEINKAADSFRRKLEDGTLISEKASNGKRYLNESYEDNHSFSINDAETIKQELFEAASEKMAEINYVMKELYPGVNLNRYQRRIIINDIQSGKNIERIAERVDSMLRANGRIKNRLLERGFKKGFKEGSEDVTGKIKRISSVLNKWKRIGQLTDKQYKDILKKLSRKNADIEGLLNNIDNMIIDNAFKEQAFAAKMKQQKQADAIRKKVSKMMLPEWLNHNIIEDFITLDTDNMNAPMLNQYESIMDNLAKPHPRFSRFIPDFIAKYNEVNIQDVTPKKSDVEVSLEDLRKKIKRVNSRINGDNSPLFRELDNATPEEQEIVDRSTDNTGEFSSENDDIRYRFIGEKGAANLDRAEEATTRLDNLGVARKMEESGKDAKAIKLATGWERGADGKWRYELGDGRFDRMGELHPERRRLTDAEKKELEESFDETMKAFEKGSVAYKGEITEDTDMADIYEAGGMERKKAKRISELEEKEQRLTKEPKHLDDYLDDDELYKAYPELRDIIIDTGNTGDAIFGKLGAYNPLTNTINLNYTSHDILIHELQHVIQRKEGFSVGGSPSTVRGNLDGVPYDRNLSNNELYNRLSGEVEARNVQSRLDMTPEERRNSLASETEDVAREDQIFLNDALGVSASMESSIEDVNRRFNEELEQQINGELQNGHVYQLGRPSNVLKKAGIPDLPIEMASARLLHKSNQENHPFDLSEVKNLPEAVQNPIAVFRSATHVGSNVILTELKHGNKNFVVAIETNRKQGKITVNSVRSIHPRTTSNIVSWINEGLVNYADKAKLKDWISEKIKSRSYLNSSNPADVKKQLDSAANIIENFENPTLLDGEISSAIDTMSDELGVQVNRVKSRMDLPEGIQRQMKGGRYPGLFDPKTGQVYMVMDEITDAADAQATMLHEIVGHKGIRGLFGDRIGEFTSRVLDSMPEEERNKWVEKYKGNEQLAAEEYVAQFAEGYENPGVWEKIKAIFRDLLRDLGIDLRLSDNDLKYILWKAKNGLKKSDGTFNNIRNSVKEKKIEQALFRTGEGSGINTVEEYRKVSREVSRLKNMAAKWYENELGKIDEGADNYEEKVNDINNSYQSLLNDIESTQDYLKDAGNDLKKGIIEGIWNKEGDGMLKEAMEGAGIKNAPFEEKLKEIKRFGVDLKGFDNLELKDLINLETALFNASIGIPTQDIYKVWGKLKANEMQKRLDKSREKIERASLNRRVGNLLDNIEKLKNLIDIHDFSMVDAIFDAGSGKDLYENFFVPQIESAVVRMDKEKALTLKDFGDEMQKLENFFVLSRMTNGTALQKIAGGRPQRYRDLAGMIMTQLDYESNTSVPFEELPAEKKDYFSYVINNTGKNGKLAPLKTVESDHLKFLLQKSKKLFLGNGV